MYSSWIGQTILKRLRLGTVNVKQEQSMTDCFTFFGRKLIATTPLQWRASSSRQIGSSPPSTRMRNWGSVMKASTPATPDWTWLMAGATATQWRYGKVSPCGPLSSGENETQASPLAEPSMLLQFTDVKGDVSRFSMTPSASVPGSRLS